VELNLANSELWLIGALSPEVENVLRRYADSRIRLKGPFPQRSLPEYYSQGSVFCLASFEEGLAMVLLQAMSCGLPTIATVNSGAGDIVEDGGSGFVIPAGSLEAIKEKLVVLYEDAELRAEMSKRALQIREASLGWDRYGEEIVRKYQALICEPVRQPDSF